MSYVCPRCGTESQHPMEDALGYCAKCHDFTGDEAMEKPMQSEAIAAKALLDAIRREIDMLRQLSEIERRAGYTQSTWQLLRDIAIRLETAALAAERQPIIDASIARQLSRSMQLNAELQQRIRELQQTEPVAWIVLSDETGNTRIWWRDKTRADEWCKKHDVTPIPLYAAAAPEEPANAQP